MRKAIEAKPTLAVVVLGYGRAKGGVTSHVDTLMAFLRKEGIPHEDFRLRDLRLWEKAWHLASAGFRPLLARRRAIQKKMAMAKAKLARLEPASGLVVHAHDPFTAQAALEDGRFPVVVTVHGRAHREFLMDYGDEALAAWVREVEERVYREAQGVLAVSQGHKAYVEEQFSLPPGKVTVLPNAVDAEGVATQAQSGQSALAQALEQMTAMGQKVVLLPRRLVENTGVHLAVEALLYLPEHYAFWIAGDGPMRSKVEETVARLGLASRVRLLGALPREVVLALMRRSWAVVVPSIPAQGVVEATSIAALEAMALGVPVVGSDLGGLAEIIRHGENGLLSPPGNPKALAEALLRLEEPGLRRALTEGALKYVREVWSVERWGQAILRLYWEVLGARPA